MGRKSRISEDSQTSQSRSSISISSLSPTFSFRKPRRKNELGDSLVDSYHLISDPHSRVRDTNNSDINTTHPDKKSKYKIGNKILQWLEYNNITLAIYKTTLLNILLGSLLGLGYFLIISKQFQQLTNFSSLTNLEKELSLPMETAFRYSFFKRVAEEDSLIKGLRNIVYDKRTEWPNVTNSFQKYALLPETVLGGAFHFLKKSWEFVGMSNLECRKGSSGTVGWADWKCSGGGDPLTFYLKANWALDSAFVTFLYLAGFSFGNSTYAGLFSCFTFILSHPQLGDWEKLFPDGDKMGSYLSTCLIVFLPQFLFTQRLPSWTHTVKLGILVTSLILVWPMQAQWILISQLSVILILHFANVISPFIITIVLGAHVTGWEYASLLTFDTSFLSWTFYTYLLLSSLLVVYILRPLVDKFFGAKLDKWMFLRAIILGIGLYLSFLKVRADLPPLLSWVEDPRMSTYLTPPDFQITNQSVPSPSNHFGVAASLLNPSHSSEEGSLSLESRWLRAIVEQHRENRENLENLDHVGTNINEGSSGVSVASVESLESEIWSGSGAPSLEMEVSESQEDTDTDPSEESPEIYSSFSQEDLKPEESEIEKVAIRIPIRIPLPRKPVIKPWVAGHHSQNQNEEQNQHQQNPDSLKNLEFLENSHKELNSFFKETESIDTIESNEELVELKKSAKSPKSNSNSDSENTQNADGNLGQDVSQTLHHFLMGCLLHKNQIMASLHSLFYENFVPVSIAILAFVTRTLYLIRERRKFSQGIKVSPSGEEGATVSSISMLVQLGINGGDGSTSTVSIHYHFLHLLSFLLLSVGFDNSKFHIVFLAQLSLLAALVLDTRKFTTAWRFEVLSLGSVDKDDCIDVSNGNGSCRIGRRAHWAFILGIVAVMMAIGRLRVDRLYELPQQLLQGDPSGIGDLVEVIKWIRQDSYDSGGVNNLKTFIGPSFLMIHTYLSGEQAVVNHKEEQLPHLFTTPDFLHHLYRKYMSVQEFHTKMTTSTNASYLLLSQDFCSNPTFPYSTTTKTVSKTGSANNHCNYHKNRGKNAVSEGVFMGEDDTDSSGDILGIHIHSRKHSGLKTVKLGSESSVTSGSCCNLEEFWEEVTINRNIESKQDSMENGRTLKNKDKVIPNSDSNKETLCHWLWSKRDQDIKPFTRMFRNRIYFVLRT